MKKPYTILLTVGALIIGMVAGGCSRKAENPRSLIFASARADALAAKILLTELRDGRLTNALELLEQQIDLSVIRIDGSLSKTSAPEREAALGTLQSVKAYREAHPRQQEAIIPDTASSATETELMSQKASSILSQVK